MTAAEEIQRLVGPRPATAAEASPRLVRFWYLSSLRQSNIPTGATPHTYTPLEAARMAAADDEAGLLEVLERRFGGQAPNVTDLRDEVA